MRFQDKIRKFVVDTFGLELADSKEERCHRFAEESLELLQACGYTKDQLQNIIEYVYSRPVGDEVKEVGGVMATLAALCSAIGTDMIKQAGNEAKRAVRNAQYIKLKHNGKPDSIKDMMLNEKRYLELPTTIINYIDRDEDSNIK